MGESSLSSLYERENTDVVIRFKGVSDIERLKIDIMLLLESLGEDAVIIDIDD